MHSGLKYNYFGYFLTINFVIDAFIWGWLQILFLKAVLQDTALSAGAAPCRNVSNIGISVPVPLPLPRLGYIIV